MGVCGSRNASDEALELAVDLGRKIAQQGQVVVTGFARGIDRQAYEGALQAGGCTIAVLSEGFPESAGRCQVNREFVHLREQGLEDNFLAISMFEPGTRWQAWRAMERNRVVVGLSAALVVVEAQEKGGTMDAAHKCLSQGKKLWVVDYLDQGPERVGNRQLLKKVPAIPLSSESLDALFEVQESGPQEDSVQLAMSLEV